MKTMTSAVFHAPELVLDMVISMAPIACLIESSTRDAYVEEIFVASDTTFASKVLAVDRAVE